MLAIELLGATTVLLYGVNLLLLPANSSSSAEAADEATGLPVVSTPYHVRVLVPCYKESLDILRRTVVAARDAPLPLGCAGKTVYLCDDGRDPKKRKWVDALGDPAVVYVSGRQRPAGEMNGESGRDWLVEEEARERERTTKERARKKEKTRARKKNQPFFFAPNPLFSFPLCFLRFFLFPFSSSTGKSGNINNVTRQLYGHTRGRVPGNELICIFDADQVS